MVKGSCVCGDFVYEFSGEPAGWGGCHCIPCRKSSGTTMAANLLVPGNQFKILSGSTRSYARKGDSGKHVTYYNCDTCANLLWTEAEALGDVKILKMGAIDDQEYLNGLGKPKTEIFCKNMCIWEEMIPGAEQKNRS